MSSLSRFFVPPNTISATQVILPSAASHHAKTVLRLRVGEKFWAHDGESRAFLCEITELSSLVYGTIIESVTLTTEPERRLTVAQALPKTTDKIEQVLQHGTEIGAAGFYIFEAERSVARLEGEKATKKVERWQGIVQSAAEQSGRGILPQVAWVGNTKSLLTHFAHFDAVLLFHEKATQPLATSLPQGEKMLLLIGPEGGFSDREVTLFTQAGALSLSLGPRVLRTETAALVALAQILVLH
jgi:16S rRNA (uracil1498-N3)-methyltransferase